MAFVVGRGGLHFKRTVGRGRYEGLCGRLPNTCEGTAHDGGDLAHDPLLRGLYLK